MSIFENSLRTVNNGLVSKCFWEGKNWYQSRMNLIDDEWKKIDLEYFLYANTKSLPTNRKKNTFVKDPLPDFEKN